MTRTTLLQHLETLAHLERPFDGCLGYWGNDFFTACGLYDWDPQPMLDGEGFTVRPIEEWYCSDSMVGYLAIYYKGRLVACSRQVGRKYPAEIFWVNPEARVEVSAVVQALCDREREEEEILLVDPAAEIDTSTPFMGLREGQPFLHVEETNPIPAQEES
jgi:hypothetical protein